MLTLLIFIVILSLLIFIHELGHFLVAKKAGIKVEEFGFGYPPRAWGKKIGETIYSLNWLPFGGFVRLYGENYLRKGMESKKALYHKSKKIRALVALAGGLGNFLLGIVCFSIIYSFIGIPTKVDYVMIDGVMPNSPAEAVGLKTNQIVVSLQGQPIKTTNQFMELVKANQGQEIILAVKEGEEGREGKIKEYRLSPRLNPPAGEGALGVAISSIAMVFYPPWQMPFRGAIVGVKEALGWGLAIFLSVGQALKSLLTGVVPEVAGPVGIYQITAGVVQRGWLLTIQFVGVLSINLAVLNLLPIPALDGSRLMFLAIEAVSGRRVKPKLEEYIHLVGMALLIGLMLLVTINDFDRLFKDNPFFNNIINSIMGEIKKLK